ncbi:oligosaccharide flippase family protein [Pradoshia sp.]
MIKESALLSINRFAKSFVQIMVTIIIARLLTIVEMGIYQQIFLIAVILGALLPFEMQTTFSYYYNKTDNERERSHTIANTFWVLFTLAMTMLVVLLIVFNVPFLMKDNSLNEYALWIGLWSMATIIGSYLENLFVSIKKAKVYSIINLSYYFIYFVIIGLTLYTTKNLLLTIELIAFFELFRVTILHLYFHVSHGMSWRGNIPLLKEQLRYTGAVGAVTAIDVVTQSSDKVIIWFFFSVELFAVYSIASKEIPFMSIITVAVITAMLPRLGRLYSLKSQKIEALKLWSESSRVLALVMFPIFWILLFFHQEFITLLYSSAYLGGSTIFLIYLLKFPLRFTVFYTPLLISGNQRLLLINTLITVVCNIVLGLLFMTLFGYLGVAAASVLSCFIGIYLQQKDVCKVFEIPQRELLPYKSILTTFFSSGAAAGAVYIVFSILPGHQLFHFIAGGIITMLICGALALVRKEISISFLFNKPLAMKARR